MIPYRNFLLLLFIGLSTVGLSTYAQSCGAFEPDLRYKDSNYQPRKGDVRCEGLINTKVSRDDQFELHRLQIGEVYYESNLKEVLTIFVPGKSNVRTVAVVGSGYNKEISANYRLDMTLEAASRKKIPVSTALKHFKPKDIGFYGKALGKNFLVPVSIITTTYDEIKDDNILVFGVKCGQNLKNLKCSYALVKNSDCQQTIKTISYPKTVSINDYVEFKIDMNTIDGVKNGETEICLNLFGQDYSTGKDVTPFQIYVRIPKL